MQTLQYHLLKQEYVMLSEQRPLWPQDDMIKRRVTVTQVEEGHLVN